MFWNCWEFALTLGFFYWLQSISLGQELLDNVFKHLNIIETAYFGLRYVDNTGQTVSTEYNVNSAFFRII